MDAARLEEEMRALEKRIGEMKATMPAHESTGAHTMKLLNLEDELDEKRRALQGQKRSEKSSDADGKGNLS